MGEIIIVGPGKTRGYPYPVCKKKFASSSSKFFFFSWSKERDKYKIFFCSCIHFPESFSPSPQKEYFLKVAMANNFPIP